MKPPSIPVNQYKSNFKKELKQYGKERLIRAYYDMLLIRKFETMLDTIKKEGVYQGISYNHRGPAHLSSGQESAAVGQAMVLDPEDQIFGSHRSHGEILAKSMSAIYKMEDKELLAIMESFMDGGGPTRLLRSTSLERTFVTLQRTLYCTVLGRDLCQKAWILSRPWRFNAYLLQAIWKHAQQRYCWRFLYYCSWCFPL